MNHDEFLVLTTTSITASTEQMRTSLGVASQGAPIDQMFRLSTDSMSQSLVSQTWRTADFMHGAVVWANQRSEEINLLTDFAAWQKQKLDYDGVYNAWLLEAISEEEFVEEAAKFAVVLREPDPERVVDLANKLVSLLPFELTTADLAEFFQTEPRSVLQAIADNGNSSEKLRALLPSHLTALDNE